MENYVVPNQRKILVVKEPTNKQSVENYYTAINLLALENASSKLRSKAGFKLWVYIAKNQNRFKFAMSSLDFCQWSGYAIKAYRSAFNELVDKGFLVEERKNEYVFYEYPNEHKEENEFKVNITIPTNKVEEVKRAEELLCNQYMS